MKGTLLTKGYSKTFLTVGLAAATLALAGCGKHFQALQNNQTELKETLQNSGQQTIQKITALQKTQDKLKQAVQQNSKTLARKMEAVEAAHLNLQGQMQNTLKQTKGGFASVEEGQHQINTSFAKSSRRLSENAGSLSALKNDLRQVQKMVAKINQHTMQVNSQTAGIAENQKKLTQMQSGISGNLEKLIAGTERVRKNLIKLQKITAGVKNTTQKVTTRVADIENKQKNLDEEIGSNIRQVVRNIEAIEHLNETVFPDEGTTKTASAKVSVKQPEKKSDD